MKWKKIEQEKLRRKTGKISKYFRFYCKEPADFWRNIIWHESCFIYNRNAETTEKP